MSTEHGLGGLFGQATNSIDGLIHTWMLTRGRFQSNGEQCSTAAFLCSVYADYRSDRKQQDGNTNGAFEHDVSSRG